ncbi:MAG: hypothetical protein EBZ44_01440 [Verrucomicrobia bacterium]|nr:hypothetical protein [Verrucomicrobiota bacterium]NDD56379.1 hypothetical protein [Verrucomicrobiota bacterium]
MSHDSYQGRRSGGGPHERRRRRHHRHGRGGFRHESRGSHAKSGGFWGWLKKLFGLNGGSSHREQGRGESRPARTEGQARAPRGPRISPPQEVLTPRLYVGNLSYDASESDLFDFFGKVAGVRNVEIVRDKGSNSKGFGFVEMQTLEGAQEAAKKLHDAEFMGRLMIVNGAKSMGERPERGPRRDDRGGPRAEIEESERAGRSSGDFDYDRGPRNPSFD